MPLDRVLGQSLDALIGYSGGRWGRLCGCITLTLGLLVAPLEAEAQQAGKVPRIGFLGTVATSPHYEALRQGLHDLGYVEGQNIAIERRSSEGRAERLPDLAAELVRLKVDVIVADTCGAPLNATSQATSTIPIVVAACNDDLVATGLISSLARPGGNITGLSELTPELGAKRLELLKEAVPKVRRVAVLWNPAYSERFGPSFRFWTSDWVEARAAAQALAMTLQSVEIRGPDEFDTAFSAMTGERADALIAFSDPVFVLHGRRIADLAAKNRLPAVYAYKEVVDAGGLFSYGPSLSDLFRRAAAYVGKILKGAINFFFTGTQLLVMKGSGIKSVADVAGKRVGAAAETTNEKALRASQPRADVVTFQDLGAGFLALEQGKIVAFVSDGIMLAGLAAKARNPKDYEVVGDFFSKEPYSCMVPENDSKWRDFVNHTIMELIDTGKYFELYDKWFGVRGVVPYPMTPQVRTYMLMQSMPE